jgi:hypothetical protein
MEFYLQSSLRQDQLDKQDNKSKLLLNIYKLLCIDMFHHLL